MLVCPAWSLYFHSMGIRLSGLTMKSCLCGGLAIILEPFRALMVSVGMGVEVNLKMALLLLVLLLGSYVSSELTNQPCKYPSIRLPRPNKKYFLECTQSQYYEEKECPPGSEFDIGLMNCAYKIESSSSATPTWVTSESSGDDGLTKGQTNNNKQSNSQSQWPFYPIELYSSCTSDGWCPHDPAKLQFCDVNGEQFMQCSNMGWILKMCPPGSLFTGNLGRCVDPRENVQTLTSNSQELQQLKGQSGQNQNQLSSSSNSNYPSKFTNLPHINLILPKPKITFTNTKEGGDNFGQSSQTLTGQGNGRNNQFVLQYPNINMDQTQYPNQYQQNVNSQQPYSLQQQTLKEIKPQVNLVQSANTLQVQQPNYALQSQSQPNSLQSSWIQVQPSLGVQTQSNTGQQTLAQLETPSSQQQSVVQPNFNQDNQQNWLNLQQTWNQNQQNLISGQTVQLTPAEAAKYPRGRLVWTSGKQPTSLETQQQLSLGSLVVDVDNLPEPWSTMDFPSFIPQNPSENAQQATATTPSDSNYQSWIVPSATSPNSAPNANNMNNNNYNNMNNNYNNINNNNYNNMNNYNNNKYNNNNNNVISTNNAVENQGPFNYSFVPTNQGSGTVNSYIQPPSPKIQVGQQSTVQGISVNNPVIPLAHVVWNQSGITVNPNPDLYQKNVASNLPSSYQWYIQNGRTLVPVAVSPSLLQPFYQNYPYQWPNHSGYGTNGGTNGWMNSNQQYSAVPNWVAQPFQQQSQAFGQQQTVPSWTVNQVPTSTPTLLQQMNQIRYPAQFQSNYNPNVQTYIVGQAANNVGAVTKSTSRSAKSRQAKLRTPQTTNKSN